MRLEWFDIQGYKNLRRVVRLEELGRFNVVHGDNNIGKSNLFESIGLLFMLLRTLRDDMHGEVSRAESFTRTKPPELTSSEATMGLRTVRSFSFFSDRGFPPEEIFNLKDALPMELRASVRLDQSELSEHDASWLAEPLELGVRLERHEDEVLIELTRLSISNGGDLAREVPSSHQLQVRRILDLVALRRIGKRVHPRFSLIRADRTLAGEATRRREEPSPLTTREPLPQDLGLELHDAENSLDSQERQRFERFLHVLNRFQDFLEPGQWRMRFDRDAERAELYFDGASARVPLRLMGSGLQQIVTLLARLVMTRADIVALEEPELNLRYDTQLRLREALSALVHDATSPFQLLLTSHSDAFETEEMFYAMLRAPSGPLIERRHRQEAARFALPKLSVPPEGAQAPLSYVTSQGLVLVPEEVRKALGLEHGGGVAFVREKAAGHYRMLTNAQFLDMIEPKDPPP
jgi:predicted ATPase